MIPTSAHLACIALATAAPEQPETAGAVDPRFATTLPDQLMEIMIAPGIEVGPERGRREVQSDLSISGHWVRAFGDRFLWQPLTLGFAYRFGRRGGTEVTLWGGMLHWGLGLGTGMIPDVLFTRLAAVVDVRWWIGPDTAMTATAGSITTADFMWGGDGWRDHRGWDIASIVWSRAALVVHHLLDESAALNVGLRCDDEWTPSPWRAKRHHRYHVSVGSLTPLGLRRPPLVQILVGDIWSVGVHAEVNIELPSEVVRTRLLGASMWTW